MDAIHGFFDIFLHLDQFLEMWINEYGTLVYVFLFLIIFVETGVVLWPWLPGDSLLFVAGTFVGLGSLNVYLLISVCFIAAVLGNTSNYFIGKFFGPRAMLLKFRGKPIIKQEHLDKTHQFYEKYGPVTIIVTRFVPILRTISPFVAGVGSMHFGKFTVYNVVGAILWVPGFIVLGYLLGSHPFVKENFELVALGIVIISVLPVIFTFLKSKLTARK